MQMSTHRALVSLWTLLANDLKLLQMGVEKVSLHLDELCWDYNLIFNYSSTCFHDFFFWRIQLDQVCFHWDFNALSIISSHSHSRFPRCWYYKDCPFHTYSMMAYHVLTKIKPFSVHIPFRVITAFCLQLAIEHPHSHTQTPVHAPVHCNQTYHTMGCMSYLIFLDHAFCGVCQSQSFWKHFADIEQAITFQKLK